MDTCKATIQGCNLPIKALLLDQCKASFVCVGGETYTARHEEGGAIFLTFTNHPASIAHPSFFKHNSWCPAWATGWRTRSASKRAWTRPSAAPRCGMRRHVWCE